MKCSLDKSYRHVISDLKQSKNLQTVKEHVVGSAVLKLKRQVSDNISAKFENNLKNLIFFTLPIVINITLVVLFYFEYYVDFKSLIAFYKTF